MKSGSEKQKLKQVITFLLNVLNNCKECYLGTYYSLQTHLNLKPNTYRLRDQKKCTLDLPRSQSNWIAIVLHNLKVGWILRILHFRITDVSSNIFLFKFYQPRGFARFYYTTRNILFAQVYNIRFCFDFFTLVYSIRIGWGIR